MAAPQTMNAMRMIFIKLLQILHETRRRKLQKT